jgi:hypothetical protein
MSKPSPLSDSAYFRSMEEKSTRTYTGTKTGEAGFDGFAGLRLGTSYTAALGDDGLMHILLPTGRPTSVTVEQWQQWFSK